MRLHDCSWNIIGSLSKDYFLPGPKGSIVSLIDGLVLGCTCGKMAVPCPYDETLIGLDGWHLKGVVKWPKL